jgi:putative membrane protein
MIPYEVLPTINATLNALSASFLVLGWRFIRLGDRESHKRCMIAAVVVSVAFLVSYIVYHLRAGTTRFPDVGLVRGIYLAILGTHTVLAAIVPVMVILTLVPALRSRFDKHRRIARFTLPIWLYVSVTGVVIYLMLYHLAPLLT